MLGMFGFWVSSPAAARAATFEAGGPAGRKTRNSRAVSTALTDFLTRVLAGRERSMAFLLAEATPKFRVSGRGRESAGNEPRRARKALAGKTKAAREVGGRRTRGETNYAIFNEL